MKRWAEETDILTLIWKEDKQTWTQEREELERNFRQQKEEFKSKLADVSDGLQSDIIQLKEQIAKRESEIEKLRLDLTTVDSESQNAQMFAKSAHASLEELKHQIARSIGGDGALADLLIRSATDKAIQEERISHMHTENERLKMELKKEAGLRRKLHNTLEDMKGAIRVIVRLRPILPSDDPGHCVEVSRRHSFLLSLSLSLFI
jgi:kinesin family member C1